VTAFGSNLRCLATIDNGLPYTSWHFAVW